jgi:hypothetical protein
VHRSVAGLSRYVSVEVDIPLSKYFMIQVPLISRIWIMKKSILRKCYGNDEECVEEWLRIRGIG